MTPLVIKAPAKLFLLGEYVVLYGGPAVLMAVDRYVTVTLEPSTHGVFSFSSEGTSLQPLQAHWEGAKLKWSQIQPGHRLTVTVLEAMVKVGAISPKTPPLTTHIDSQMLFADGQKLGLGSSAAVCNALVVAFQQSLLRNDQHFAAGQLNAEFIYNVHRAFQQGQGSGADIAAGLHGGVFTFQRVSDHLLPVVKPCSLPENLHCAYIPVGKPASTTSALKRLRDYQMAHPGKFTQALTPLLNLANDGIEALRRNLAGEFAAVCHRYCHNLSDFGRIIGFDIVSEPHRFLHLLADKQQVAYKPSGAGSGDFGIAFSSDINKLQEFEAAASTAGFAAMALSAGQKCQVVGSATQGIVKSP